MKDLTVGKESNLIFRFAMPMLLGNVFQQLYNIVDSIIVGNFLGKLALASVGASFPIIFALTSLIIGIASGGTVVISQYFGAKKIEQVQKAIGTIYIFIFFASILLSTIGITFSEDIFRLIKLPEEILPQAKTYLNIYLSGLVVLFGFNGISAILRGLGDSKTPLYFMIFSTIANIALDLLFVLVFKWGIAGVAIATVSAQTLSFIVAVVYLNKKHEIINLKLKKLKFDNLIFNQSLKIGLPTGLQQTFVSLGMVAILSIVNRFGSNVIAAYSVAIRIDSLAMLPAMNIGQALSTFVGQNLGANKTERVKSGMRATFLISSSISVGVTLMVVLFGDILMGLFTNDPIVIEIGEQYLIIVSSFYLIFSAMFTINGVLRGAGDTLIPMFITLFSLWIIRIPFAHVLSNKIGETGIWWAVPIAWFTGTIISYIYYLSGNWKTKGVVKHVTANGQS